MYLILLALLAFLVLLWCLKRWKDLHVLQNLGYPVPPVNFIDGNLLDLFSGPSMLEKQVKWMEEVAVPFGSRGKIMGWYRGPCPAIYCSNPEFMKEVLIKRKENFVDRPMLDRSDYIPHLILLKGSNWKRVRSTLAPTFSTARIKQMTGMMCQCVDIFVDTIGKCADENRDADFFQLYKSLTLDVIGQCAMGMKVNCQQDKDDMLHHMTKQVVKDQTDTTAAIVAFFPVLESLLAWLFPGGRKASTITLLNKCMDVVKKRKNIQYNKDETPVDVFQQMLDAAGGKLGEHKKLSETEVAANALVLLLGGYDTTSTNLAFTTYLLAAHPHIQERVFQEVEEVFGTTTDEQLSPEVLKEKIQELTYMNQVINESLRMYPPIPMHFGRRAIEAQEIMGKFIPKGTSVMVPAWHIHHDPELWPDPWTFNPDRFAPENKSNIADMSFMPFGEGQRACIGVRFANLEIKLALSQLLRHFEVRMSQEGNTPHPISIATQGVTLEPEGRSIFLRPVRRQKKTQ